MVKVGLANRGVAAVVANRKKCTVGEFRNQNTVEDVILYPNAFEGVAAGKSTILCPDTTSQAWNDCLYIAMNSATQDNPIGNCLWFLGTSYFNSKVTTQNGFEYYNFGTGAKRIIEKVVIGGHTFFRVEGYTL